MTFINTLNNVASTLYMFLWHQKNVAQHKKYRRNTEKCCCNIKRFWSNIEYFFFKYFSYKSKMCPLHLIF